MPTMRRFRTLNNCFKTEAEMGAVVMPLLRANGYSKAYPELRDCDVVVVRDIDSKVIAMELKLKITTKAIMQAESHKKHAHGVAIIVNVLETEDGYWLRNICKEHGVGVFRVERDLFHPDGKMQSFDTPPTYSLVCLEEPLIKPYVNVDWYTSCMTKRAEYHTIPGMPGPTTVTQFRATAYRLQDWVLDNQGKKLEEAVRGIKHHYDTHKHAQYRLKAIINEGGIPGMSLDYEDGLHFKEPEESFSQEGYEQAAG